jgi:peroxiredoxin
LRQTLPLQLQKPLAGQPDSPLFQADILAYFLAATDTFALIGVHVGGSTVKQLKEIMDKEKLPWRSFVDLGNAGAGEIATKWNHSATPTFYVIDHKGVIRYKWAAPPGTKVMDAALEEVIGEAEKDAKKPPN